MNVNALLAEGVDACRLREQRAFDLATRDTSGVVLFGAGRLGRKALTVLRAAGQAPLAFADNNQSLWNTQIESVPVLSPADAAKKYGASAAFVITVWAAWNDTLSDQVASLHALGCRTVLPFSILAWKYPDAFLPHVQIDLPSRVHEQSEAVLRCAELWADEASQREYAAHLRWHLLADFSALGAAQPNPYWQPDLIHLSGDNDVFVDAGAFDGDTVEQFIAFSQGRFQRIYAFEPDPANFARLQQRIAKTPAAVQSRIVARQQAVGDFDGPLRFEMGGGEGSKVGGDEQAECVRLDSAISDAPTYIKYDIEGFEPQALAGSRRLITEHAPALAICVYHVQDHLWNLALQVHAMNPDYRFYLRPHGQLWETVCYAIPLRTVK